jgi:hypothetical protein
MLFFPASMLLIIIIIIIISSSSSSSSSSSIISIISIIISSSIKQPTFADRGCRVVSATDPNFADMRRSLCRYSSLAD